MKFLEDKWNASFPNSQFVSFMFNTYQDKNLYIKIVLDDDKLSIDIDQ